MNAMEPCSEKDGVLMVENAVAVGEELQPFDCEAPAGT